jgi:translation initiation factor 2B subunit (eIF-2B alpha/beta/delta family)
LLARESAGALATFTEDPQALVTACRRLVDRHLTAGTVWWLAARVLAAADPSSEAWRAAEEIEDDPTSQVVAAALPEDATVVVVGWPEQAGDALRRRADVEALVIDAGGEGEGFSRRLRNADVEAVDVPDSGVGAAVAESDLVLLEASALGPDGFVAPCGSRAAAAVAQHAGVPVWVVAGTGRVLPARLWQALVQRLDAAEEEAWDRADEVVPLDLADTVYGPLGPSPAFDAPKRADCPVAPELLKAVS